MPACIYFEWSPKLSVNYNLDMNPKKIGFGKKNMCVSFQRQGPFWGGVIGFYGLVGKVQAAKKQLFFSKFQPVLAVDS